MREMKTAYVDCSSDNSSVVSSEKLESVESPNAYGRKINKVLPTDGLSRSNDMLYSSKMVDYMSKENSGAASPPVYQGNVSDKASIVENEEEPIYE